MPHWSGLAKALLSVGALVCALPAAVSAADDVSWSVGDTGQPTGVRTIRAGADAVVTFTGEAAPVLRILRKEKGLVARCTARPSYDPLAARAPVVRRAVVVPARGKSVRIRRGFGRRTDDTCTIWSRGAKGLPLAVATLTPRGAEWLGEFDATVLLYFGFFAAEAVPGRSHGKAPTLQQVVAVVKRWTGGSESPLADSPIAALANPGDSPPPKHVGYWSDGDQHFVLSVVTPAGRRVYMDFQADGVEVSNIEVFTSDL
jgi:hypothetical protein